MLCGVFEGKECKVRAVASHWGRGRVGVSLGSRVRPWVNWVRQGKVRSGWSQRKGKERNISRVRRVR